MYYKLLLLLGVLVALSAVYSSMETFKNNREKEEAEMIDWTGVYLFKSNLESFPPIEVSIQSKTELEGQISIGDSTVWNYQVDGSFNPKSELVGSNSCSSVMVAFLEDQFDQESGLQLVDLKIQDLSGKDLEVESFVEAKGCAGVKMGTWAVNSANELFKREDSPDSKHWTKLDSAEGHNLIGLNGEYVYARNTRGSLEFCKRPCSGNWQTTNTQPFDFTVGKDDIWMIDNDRKIYRSSDLGQKEMKWVQQGVNAHNIVTNSKFAYTINKDTGDIWMCRKPCDNMMWQRTGIVAKELTVNNTSYVLINKNNQIFKGTIDPGNGSLGKPQPISGDLSYISMNDKYVYGTDHKQRIFQCELPCDGGWREVDGKALRIASF